MIQGITGRVCTWAVMNHRLKHKLRTVGLLAIGGAVVIAVAGALLWWHVGRSGTSAVEQWVGRQLQGVANAYLNPQLGFDELDYHHPRTVVLRNCRLTAVDPIAGPSDRCVDARYADAEVGEDPT